MRGKIHDVCSVPVRQRFSDWEPSRFDACVTSFMLIDAIVHAVLRFFLGFFSVMAVFSGLN